MQDNRILISAYDEVSRQSGMRTAKTVSITLPPDLLIMAQAFAQKEHRTMSELFRAALRRYMARDSDWDMLLKRTRAKGKRCGSKMRRVWSVFPMNTGAVSADDSAIWFQRRRLCGKLEMQKNSVFSDFYCLPNKLALMGHSPVANLSRPCSTSSGQALRD
jgi:hypothetical protein